MSSCLNCKKPDYMVPDEQSFRVEKVSNTDLKRICYDMICIRCGLVFVEGAIPNAGKPSEIQQSGWSKVNTVRREFIEKRLQPKKRYQIVEQKRREKLLYTSWITWLDSARLAAHKQLDSRSYPDHAHHALYVLLFLFSLAHGFLVSRLRLTEEWLWSEKPE